MSRLGILLLSLILANQVFAKDLPIDQYKEKVISLNQNIGTYYYIGNYISRDIKDSSDHTIGSVQDFLINNQGEVEKIVSDLNVLTGETTTLDLDYADLGQSTSSYQLAYKAEEMEEKLANMLSNIETASGKDITGLVSARRLQGRHITLPSGEAIGQVDQVITDKTTKEVVGILMRNISTRPAYEKFALPYPEGLRIKNTGFSNNLELSEAYADVVIDFTAEGIPN